MRGQQHIKLSNHLI